MATVIPEMPEPNWPQRKAGSWLDPYLDGRVWCLQHGEDFTCEPRTAAAYARNVAKRRGLTVRVVKGANPGMLYVQARDSREAQ